MTRHVVRTAKCVDGPLKGREEHLGKLLLSEEDSLKITFNTKSGTHRYHGEKNGGKLVIRGNLVRLFYDEDQMQGFERELLQHIPELHSSPVELESHH